MRENDLLEPFKGGGPLEYERLPLNGDLENDLRLGEKEKLLLLLIGDLFRGDLDILLNGDLEPLLTGDLDHLLPGDLEPRPGDLIGPLPGDLDNFLPPGESDLHLPGDLENFRPGDLDIRLGDLDSLRPAGDLEFHLAGDLENLLGGVLEPLLKGEPLLMGDLDFPLLGGGVLEFVLSLKGVLGPPRTGVMERDFLLRGLSEPFF